MSAGLGSTAGVLGVGLMSCATEPKSSVRASGTLAAAGRVRFRPGKVYFFGHPNPGSAEPPSLAASAVAAGVRNHVVALAGVDAAIEQVYKQPSKSVPNDTMVKAGLNDYWTVLTKGVEGGTGGLIEALTGVAPPGLTPVLTGAYAVNEETGVHVKWGWVTFAKLGTPPQAYVPNITVKRENDEIAVPSLVGIGMTAEVLSW